MRIPDAQFFYMDLAIYGHHARLVRYICNFQVYLVCFFVDSFGNAQIFIENLQP